MTLTLHSSPTSPYARKAHVAVIEAGLADRVALSQTDPWASDSSFVALSPLSKIPCLITPDLGALYDSPVIVDYLDALAPDAGLIPKDLTPRVIALRLQALADGICDAAILRRMESQRPDGEKSPSWLDRQRAAMHRGWDALEAEARAGRLGADADVGTLSVAVTLGYMDLRWADEAWRDGHPALAGWYAAFADRPSLKQTDPNAG